METFLQFLKNDILYSPVGTCCPSGGTYLPIILEMFRSRSDMWPWETWITQPDPFFTRPSCLPDPKFSGLVDQLCPHCTLGTPLGWSVGVFLNRCVRYKVCEDTARQGSSDTGSAMTVTCRVCYIVGGLQEVTMLLALKAYIENHRTRNTFLDWKGPGNISSEKRVWCRHDWHELCC